MPITFSINHENGYSIAKFEGRISDKELLNAYKAFYTGDDWQPGQNELVDFSLVDLKEITTQGMRNLAELAESVFKAHNIPSVKTAIYAPKDFPFGLSRMYEAVSFESPEKVNVFRNILEAEAWLMKEDTEK